LGAELSVKCTVLRFVVTDTRLHGFIILKTTKVSAAVRNLNLISSQIFHRFPGSFEANAGEVPSDRLETRRFCAFYNSSFRVSVWCCEST